MASFVNIKLASTILPSEIKSTDVYYMVECIVEL